MRDTQLPPGADFPGNGERPTVSVVPTPTLFLISTPTVTLNSTPSSTFPGWVIVR